MIGYATLSPNTGVNIANRVSTPRVSIQESTGSR